MVSNILPRKIDGVDEFGRHIVRLVGILFFDTSKGLRFQPHPLYSPPLDYAPRVQSIMSLLDLHVSLGLNICYVSYVLPRVRPYLIARLSISNAIYTDPIAESRHLRLT